MPDCISAEALPHLNTSGHGAVLTMVSVGAFIFAPMLSIYATMKPALMSMTSNAGSYITGQVIIADGGGTPR